MVDFDAERREKAEKLYPGCKTFATYQELFACDDIDLVVCEKDISSLFDKYKEKFIY